jgi:DNA-binding transcriptional LysR family regulator
MTVAETDCVAALPSRMAVLCVQLLPLKHVPATFPLPRMNTVMVWHERTNEDRGAKLFREIVLEAARA